MTQVEMDAVIRLDGQCALPWAETRARRTDPDTSHQAAARSSEFSGKHAAAIFAWLCAHPAGGTKDEIALGTGIDATAVARRMKALCATAGVRDSGERRSTPTGRLACVWVVSYAGVP